MTYSSLSVEQYPATVTPAEFELSATKSVRLFDWDHRSRDCYPHVLAEWAKSQDMPAYFVDNEWVRVPVSSTQLLVFAKQVLGIDEAEYLRSRAAAAEGIVVIESEAF